MAHEESSAAGARRKMARVDLGEYGETVIGGGDKGMLCPERMGN